MQAAVPCCLFSDGDVHMTLIGGTNAEMAPQIDFAMMVALSLSLSYYNSTD